MDAFRVVGLASYAPPDEQGRTTVTRELKLALIVGFSLVLFVTVLVSDHLSRARHAELPRIADPTSALTALPPSGEIKPASERIPAQREAPAPRTGPLPGDPGSPFGPGQAPVIAANGGQTPPESKLAIGPMVNSVEREALQPDGAQLDNPLVFNQTPEPSREAATPPTPLVEEPPAGRVAAAPAPKIEEYTVLEGDTLYDLSLRFYKDARHWKALQTYNRDRLTKDGQPRAGARILIPSLDVLLGRPATQVAAADLPPLVKPDNSRQAAKPAAKPATYTVRKNDTMTSIAQRMLGSSKRVKDLMKANPGVDPDRLQVGAELRIPA